MNGVLRGSSSPPSLLRNRGLLTLATPDTDGGNAGESKPQDELKETGVEVRGGTAAENEEGSDVQDKEAVAVVRDNAEEEEEIKISQDRRPDVRAADVDEEKQVISPPGDNNFEDDEDQGITKIATNKI